MSQRSNRPRGVNPSKRIVKNKKNQSKIPVLQPAYPGQVVKQMKFEGTPLLLTTTVTTGLIAQIIAIRASQIQNFATRVGVLFEEYRIVRVKFMVKAFASTNTGLFTHWIDEKDVATAPTSAEALQKSSKQFSASSPSPHVISWTARDPLDLQYTDIGTIATPVSGSYKIYTDAANFGSSIVATPYAQVTSVFTFQFRGYN